MTLNKTAFAAAQQVVSVRVHAFSTSLTIQWLVQRHHWLAEVQLAQNCTLGWLQTEPKGSGGTRVEPG